MRILHAPTEVAGQLSIISRAQRKEGHKSDVWLFSQSHYQYEYDYSLEHNHRTLIGKLWIRFTCFFKAILSYDIFHFHGGVSLWPYGLDIPLLKLFGKKVVMEYWGSDIIQTDIMKKFSYLKDEDFLKYLPKIDDDGKRVALRRMAHLVDKMIVGDSSLQIFFPSSVVINKVVDLSKLPYVGAMPSKKITVIHAPTHRVVKGTKHILKAVKLLKKEKYKFNFVLIEKKPHQEALEMFKKADIIIDDVLQGPYGILATECMALGKPVLCHIHPKQSIFYPNLPVISSNPDNIYLNLKDLLEHPKKRERLGALGRKYVEENHDSLKIAKQLIKLYKDLYD